MNFMFKGESINYNYFGGKEDTILFLHGWGGNLHSFDSTINLLKNKYNILTLTMPTIKPTCQVWLLTDYVNLILNILKMHQYKKLFIVCHSFGFRVVSLLDKQINICKIIITGGAGLKQHNIIENKNKQTFLKIWKFLYNQIASPDYISLSKTNKQTFKNIVNLNTINFVNFNCPILLFWGKQDKETPFCFAIKLKKKNNAKMVLSKGGHFAYLEDNALFNNEVIKFLKV